jgi:hypothetical protein
LTREHETAASVLFVEGAVTVGVRASVCQREIALPRDVRRPPGFGP